MMMFVVNMRMKLRSDTMPRWNRPALEMVSAPGGFAKALGILEKNFKSFRVEGLGFVERLQGCNNLRSYAGTESLGEYRQQKLAVFYTCVWVSKFC